MAKEKSPEELAAEQEKKRLKEEKKKLKKDQADQKKEAKKRAKEIARQEEELDEDREGNGFVTFLATLFIILLWLGVICVVIKLDIGGFGSSVLTPILKDVPVVNLILPKSGETETLNPEDYGGYSNLRDAVAQIYLLEAQLEASQTQNNDKDAQLEALKAEIERLREFETMQVDFQRIRNEFYSEVIYAENGPGAEEYRKWYEEMDPTTAEYLYKQVVQQLEASQEIKDYVQAYSEMKPKQAAAILEEMTDNDGIQLVARMRKEMNAEDRGNILGVMDSAVAARVTKILDPEN